MPTVSILADDQSKSKAKTNPGCFNKWAALVTDLIEAKSAWNPLRSCREEPYRQGNIFPRATGALSVPSVNSCFTFASIVVFLHCLCFLHRLGSFSFAKFQLELFRFRYQHLKYYRYHQNHQNGRVLTPWTVGKLALLFSGGRLPTINSCCVLRN